MSCVVTLEEQGQALVGRNDAMQRVMRGGMTHKTIFQALVEWTQRKQVRNQTVYNQ